jgi:hypothetical protein
MNELELRTEDGPLERSLRAATEHTSAAVVISVEPDGQLTVGWITRGDAPQDAVLRLMCGAQSALGMLAGVLTKQGAVN